MIQPGQTLLHFRVVDKLGEGGMGEVWKAVDTTLDREVAIKVLPEAFAQDADRLTRFEREAKVLGAMAHPNIASIFGLFQDSGLHFLAMEMVPGDDLSTRIASGPLPLDDALEIAGQVADALESAHEKGIVHRDLKPANIRVAPDGRVRVLDFGLAKSVEPGQASGHSPTLAPTVTSAGTVAGMIMGTAAYMSPEQARGKPVDRQSDVWAFGCVLYEMLTGRAGFEGETVTDVLTGILHRDPDWDALPAVPQSVDRVLRGCLVKNKRERLRDIGDVGLLLRGVDDDSEADASGAATPDANAQGGVGRTWRAWAVVSTLALAVLAGLVAFGPLRPGGASSSTRQAIISGITQLTDLPGTQASPSLSGDGEQLLFVADDGGDADIFLQRVGGENPVNLTADYAVDDFQPAFSPDKQQIAFASRREGGGIFVMGATGESPRMISDTGFDPAWSPDGAQIIYSTERVTNPYNRLGPATLWVIDLETLERGKLNDIDATGASWSPNGHRIAFWTHSATVGGQRDIWTMAADGTAPLPVMEDVSTDWDPFWSAGGEWLYFISDRGGRPDLWRVPIDERTGKVQGLLEPVTTGPSYIVEASAAADGRNIAIHVLRKTGKISTMDFDPVRERIVGTPTTVLTSSNPLTQMDVSMDGSWLAYRTTAPREALYVMRTDGSARRKILDDEHRNRGPIWSPNREWIAFYSNRGGSYNSWAIRPNGTGLRQLTRVEGGDVNTSGPLWTQEGDGILFWKSDGAVTSLVTALLGPEGIEGVTAPLTHQETSVSAYMSASMASPDGRLLAGPCVDPQGESALCIFDMTTGDADFPTRKDGRLFRVSVDLPTWIDSTRVLFWDYVLRTAVVWDIELQQARVVPDVPGPGEMSVRDGGRKLILNSFPVESDIWMLTLSE